MVVIQILKVSGPFSPLPHSMANRVKQVSIFMLYLMAIGFTSFFSHFFRGWPGPPQNFGLEEKNTQILVSLTFRGSDSQGSILDGYLHTSHKLGSI